MDDLEFEAVSSGSQSTQTSASASASLSLSCSSTSSCQSRGRTKASRRKLQQSNDDEPWRNLEHEILHKRVRFSLSPEHSTSSSKTSRRTRQKRFITLANEDLTTNDATSSPSTPTPIVRGAGTDIFAIQDAGSYRMVHDDTTYLCSTIPSAANPTHAICDLALMLASSKTRRLLWAHMDVVSTMDGILTVLSMISDPIPCGGPLMQLVHIPNETLRHDDDCSTILSSQDTTASTTRHLSATALEALAAVLHFISWDCTLSAPSAVTPGISRKLRNMILEHSGALLGISSLLLHDHVVRRLLLPMSQVPSTPLDDDRSSKASSCATETSNDGDPTSFGRRKRKRRRIDVCELDTIPEDISSKAHTGVNNDAMSFLSYGSSDKESDDGNGATNTHPLLTEVRAKLVRITKEETKKHTCGIISVCISPSMLALEAMLRIVQGKEGDEDSCMDIAADDGILVNGEETEEFINPLLMTNILLRKSGCLPLLARGVAETLAAIIASMRSPQYRCSACDADLHHRLTVLLLLIDGACCLSMENRQELCLQGCLVGSILQFLELVSDLVNGSPDVHVDDASSLHEMGLVSIRTLTSLSHENSYAEEQLMKSYTFSSKEVQLGADVIADLLFRVANSKNLDVPGRNLNHHLEYDVTILCLNILTNVIEAHGLLQRLAHHKVSRGTVNEIGFIDWLSNWVVLQTVSFRDDVMRGTFGKVNGANGVSSQDSQGYLEKDADENLVTAGNGFILLACCMIQRDQEDTKGVELTRAIQATVIGTMPRNEDGSSTGVTLITNTLKAFCNFYYYSVRDLSVAIVAPVKKLILQLGTIEF